MGFMGNRDFELLTTEAMYEDSTNNAWYKRLLYPIRHLFGFDIIAKAYTPLSPAVLARITDRQKLNVVVAFSSLELFCMPGANKTSLELLKQLKDAEIEIETLK